MRPGAAVRAHLSQTFRHVQIGTFFERMSSPVSSPSANSPPSRPDATVRPQSTSSQPASDAQKPPLEGDLAATSAKKAIPEPIGAAAALTARLPPSTGTSAAQPPSWWGFAEPETSAPRAPRATPPMFWDAVKSGRSTLQVPDDGGAVSRVDHRTVPENLRSCSNEGSQHGSSAAEERISASQPDGIDAKQGEVGPVEQCFSAAPEASECCSQSFETEAARSAPGELRADDPEIPGSGSVSDKQSRGVPEGSNNRSVSGELQGKVLEGWHASWDAQGSFSAAMAVTARELGIEVPPESAVSPSEMIPE